MSLPQSKALFSLSSQNQKEREAEMEQKRTRGIKLLCPSLSKKIEMVACDEQKIDLGFIAHSFGIDPATVKLNSHFISRGIDLISSSVTWKSLLSFFSAKGLSTGKDDGDALLVTGKLCKVGNKRSHDSQHAGNGTDRINKDHNAGSSRGNHLEVINLFKNKRFRENNSGEILNGIGLKRKQPLEDSLHKKLKIHEDMSALEDKTNDINNISSSQFTCSYTSNNLKRLKRR